jgi:hypothetical protein
MMASCLSQSLTANPTARLLIVRHKYTFDGAEYAPLMLKTIMGLATIDSVATTQSLRDNLHALGTFSATVNRDITKIHKEFDSNYQQLLARGATLDNNIGVLFDAYRVVPCYNFTSYMKLNKPRGALPSQRPRMVKYYHGYVQISIGNEILGAIKSKKGGTLRRLRICHRQRNKSSASYITLVIIKY